MKFYEIKYKWIKKQYGMIKLPFNLFFVLLTIYTEEMPFWKRFIWFHQIVFQNEDINIYPKIAKLYTKLTTLERC